ncbi:hypothetical protein PB1_03540 [Bacillus methanolicus PB1]|uniref:ATP-grasp domain-containing protein n=1 Tax=Bacillus methanolicus PB1 TaxID=997296 RepID=I3E658_BACMT|nr:YheC/YheD family protein [Bacillus methanolicus]EIJ81979.1 hypothetical protein PB1_03540 [Bacillus methanolicus PB1]
MRKRYPIEIIDDCTKTVFYPNDLYVSSEIQTIAFGNKTANAQFIPHPDNKNKIYISKDIQTELKFPDLAVPLHVFIDNDTLFIGPLVGIFTAGFSPFLIRPIGERTLFFAKLLSVQNKVGALAFVFGEQHIDWDQSVIKGYFYQQKGWEMIEVPFPNVVYDRLPNRKTEKLSELRKIKERMQNDYLIPWYNPGFFNKLDVYERLEQDDTVSRYLPETHPFISFSLMESMLAKYGHLYVKPKNGSLGIGIHQILYDKKDGSYYCRFRNSLGENKLIKSGSLEGLVRRVFTSRKLGNLLIQQGIHLIRKDKRQVDFRVHTNKDEHGAWRVSAVAAKVAGSGSATTHINNGGTIKTLEEIFTDKEEKEVYIHKLTNAALALSQALENMMEGIIGEIGFDMGIDRNGDVWLFEANSKPGRSIFKHPQLKKFDLLTRTCSLAFAVFLTEKAIKNPEEIFK